jgi:hypothetical protein
VSEAFNLFLKHDDDDKSITVNTLRQAWVNSLKDASVDDRSKLANSMGHSINTAMKTYQRPDNGVVSTYMDKNSKLKDYGEDGYYYTDKQILDYQNKDELTGDMLLMR